MSSSRRIRCSSPSILISVPEYLPNRIAVAGLDLERAKLAVVLDLAVADGDDLALDRLLLGGVGDDDAALGLLFLARRFTITRSCSGRIFMVILLVGARFSSHLARVLAVRDGRSAPRIRSWSRAVSRPGLGLLRAKQRSYTELLPFSQIEPKNRGKADVTLP